MAPADPRRAQLRRLKLYALAMLLAMLAGFVLSHLNGEHGAWAWVGAFCEAAMVGALADWFAVVALFRRPLNLPIPHTAIIPRSKARIADSLALFVRDHILEPEARALLRGCRRHGGGCQKQPAKNHAQPRETGSVPDCSAPGQRPHQQVSGRGREAGRGEGPVSGTGRQVQTSSLKVGVGRTGRARPKLAAAHASTNAHHRHKGQGMSAVLLEPLPRRPSPSSILK